MKIGYVLFAFPKLSESFILNEIVELLKRGNEVYIFSLKRSQDVFHNEVEQYELLKRTYFLPNQRHYINKLLFHFSSIGTFGWKYPSENIKSKAFSIAAAKYFFKFAKKIELDIIQAHFNRIAAHTAMLLSQSSNVSYTFTGHAVDIFVEPSVTALKTRMENAKAVITPSYYNREYLHTLTDVDKNKINVVRACLDIEKFNRIQRNPDNFRILTVCRLVEKKGLKYSILAIKEISYEFPEISYRIVGSGPLENELKKLVNQLGLEKNIQFLGDITDDSLIYELSKATIFVLPCIKAKNGDMDVCPLTLQEAMIAKIPVVSTIMASIPELIENKKEGLLVESKNVEQLVEAIKNLLEHKNLREMLGENGRKKIENKFNISYEVKKLLEIWST